MVVEAPTSVPPALLAELLAGDLFAGLPDDALAFVTQTVEHRHLSPGTRLIHEGADPDAIYFVLRGEVALRSQERFIGTLRAPATLGLAGEVDERKTSASVDAFSPCDVLLFPTVHMTELMGRNRTFARNVLRTLTAQLRGLHSAAEQTRAHLDDHFVRPNARLLQGPYAFDGSEMTAIVVRCDPARIERLLPPGARPIPGSRGRYLLTFNRFTDVHSVHPSGENRFFHYKEVTPFIPCMAPGGRPGVASPELYLDSYMGILLGREMYGFPKRFGKVDIYEDRLDLAVDDRMFCRGSWSGARDLSAGEFITDLIADLYGVTAAPRLSDLVERVWTRVNKPAVRRFWPAVPVILHNQVADAFNGGDGLRIDELVEVPFCVHAVGDFQRLQDFELQNFDDWILAGEAIGGYRLRIDMTFGVARPAWDYRAHEAGSKPTAQQRLRPWASMVRDMLVRF